ncbi:MAG: cyclic nucleotide-binding domain-containing protein [Desulfococcaceae bacterium]
MKIDKYRVTDGLFLVDIPEARLSIQCGCPADSVKHLARRGLIQTRETDGYAYQTGPNAVLLSDVLVQNGSFANLAEFPVLQMLYRQGMLIPGHPNNTGIKPMLIGIGEQVRAQMAYIHRGNYGLVSEEEMIETGVPPETAREMMRLKLKFAFGRITPADEMLDTRIVEDAPVELRGGVFIRRLKFNVFEIRHGDEAVTVDLNLGPDGSYVPSYPLDFHHITREYFAVIHSGEGDGWNVNRPCMSSILMFQGRIYLIDAGPNVLHSLTALGIGVNEVEGIFHTHAHDDHIAGFSTLMRADRRIKYFATPLVRASVARKLSALMSMPESFLEDYFEIRDLIFDQWNDIDGLEVMPAFSPHPVETSILMFRTLWVDGYRSYAHFADIVSLEVLAGFVTDDDNQPGVSRDFYKRVRDLYLGPFDIKKLDVGGGLIHGDARDFRHDPSDKIVLSHTSEGLTAEQKQIGSGAPFGMVDVLIPATQNYLHAQALEFLRTYFPDAPLHQLRILLNNRLALFNPQSILLKDGAFAKEIHLILTGNVERIQSEMGIHSILSAGALIGEFSVLESEPSAGAYRAANYVQALCLPRSLYLEFVNHNQLFDGIERLQARRDFLQKTWLFGEVVSYPTQNRLATAMTRQPLAEGETFDFADGKDVCLVRSGALERRHLDPVRVETLVSGCFFGEERALFGEKGAYRILATEAAELYRVPGDMLLDIPVVRWKLFEAYQKRHECDLAARHEPIAG